MVGCTLISVAVSTFFLVTGSGAAFPSPSRAFNRQDVLVADTYRLLWTVDNQDITLEMQVQTKGWVAFGLSRDGKMVQSDMVTGWIRDGQTRVQDRFAAERKLPTIDGSQDWDVISGKETDSYTCLTVRRKLRNCDQDDRDIEYDDIHVIYAWDDGEPAVGLDLSKHKQQGSKLMNLMEKPDPVLGGATPYPFTVNQFTIPSTRRTTYLGQFFAVPNELLAQTHYIVKMEPVIPEASRDLVYHVVLMYCSENAELQYANRQYSPFSGYGDPSLNTDIPGSARGACYRDFIYAWSKGGEAFYSPKDVGSLLGPPALKSVLAMEVHYDNPLMTPGVIDTSGIKLWVVSTPRLHTGGHLYMLFNDLSGNGRYGIIPPRQKRFFKYTPCAAECFSEAMKDANEPELHIYAIFQHANHAARSVRTLLMRDGKVLAPVVEEMNYNSHSQQIRRLSRPVSLKPGDELVLECGYTTLEKTNTTVSGVGLSEEMCLSFVMFYPYLPLLSTCDSRINITEMAIRLGYTDLTLNNDVLDTVRDPATGAVSKWVDVVNDPKTWTSDKVVALQESYRNNTYYRLTCDGRTIDDSFRRVYPLPPVCNEVPPYTGNAPRPTGLYAVVTAFCLICIWVSM